MHTGTDAPEFAEIIVQQMGGMPTLRDRANASSFKFDLQELSISFRFTKSQVANYFKVTLNADNLYDLEAWKIPTSEEIIEGIEPTQVYSNQDIYNDSLPDVFERVTGVKLR